MLKKSLAFFLSVVLCFSLIVPVFAATNQKSALLVEDSSVKILDLFEQMKNQINYIFSVILSLFGNSSSDAVKGFSVSDISVETKEDAAIKVIKNNYKYYLYIPSYMDTSEIKLNVEDGYNIAIDGKKISDGEVTSVLNNKSIFTLSVNGSIKLVNIVKSANVSTIYICTDSGNMDDVYANKEYKQQGTLVYVGSDGDVQYDNVLDHIKGRGNSSWNYAKKGFNIKLDKSTNLDNLGKNKKWSLIPNQIDETLIHNEIAYDLADEIDLMSMKNTQVDLYLNGSYNGTYLMTVKNEIGSGAIDINELESDTEDVNEADLEEYSAGKTENAFGLLSYKYRNIPNNPQDITGGYLLELDHSGYGNEASGFITAKNQRVVVKSPEFCSKEQVEYIGSFYQEFENAVFSPDGYNELGKHYSEYIDVESFAKYFLLTEYLKSGDSYITSVFMYKDSDISGDGLIHAGPVWDYDSALGNNGGSNKSYLTIPYADPEGQFYSLVKSYGTNNMHIYTALYQHSEFRKIVADLYKTEFTDALNVLLAGNEAVGDNLKPFAEYYENIKTAADMNFTRWQILGSSYTGKDTGKTYYQNMMFLQNFLCDRKAFMDKTIETLYEDYVYTFIVNSTIYGVKSIGDYSVEIYKGSGNVGDTVEYGGKTFTVVSKK